MYKRQNRYTSGCTTSACRSVVCTVYAAPVAPTTASVDTSNYCTGYTGNIILTATGGTGTILTWYTTSCGGTLVGTGTPKIILGPGVSTTYYAAWQQTSCTISTCATVNVTVSVTPVVPVLAAVDRSGFCANDAGNISLSVSGGSGTNLKWYRTSCGGTYAGSGNPLVIASPTQSTKYYVRWENSCGNSTCVTVTDVVVALPVAPTSVTSTNNNFCTNLGGTINLTAVAGSGTTLGWYTVSCGGTLVGTGAVKTISAPTTTTTYWARWENAICGNSTCKSIIVTVIQLPVACLLYTSPSPRD